MRATGHTIVLKIGRRVKSPSLLHNQIGTGDLCVFFQFYSSKYCDPSLDNIFLVLGKPTKECLTCCFLGKEQSKLIVSSQFSFTRASSGVRLTVTFLYKASHVMFGK